LVRYQRLEEIIVDEIQSEPGDLLAPRAVHDEETLGANGIRDHRLIRRQVLSDRVQ
jgi:hypothetical protein